MNDWQTIDTPPPLGTDVVHIWQANLEPDINGWEKLTSMLSDDEQAKASSFHFEKHKRRYTVGRSILRTLLGGYLNCSPTAINFTYNNYGKPSLKDNPTELQFNVSRTDEIMLCAFVLKSDIGIDIEAIKPNIDCISISQHVFSAQERNTLQGLEGKELNSAFFRIWSRKEAYIKARGVGLSHPLQKFSVSMDKTLPVPIEHQSRTNKTKRWRLYDIAVENNYSAAIAIEASKWRLSHYHFSK